MFMDVPVRRINQICDRMSQDGYDLDSVARTRLRLMLEDEPMPCLQALEEYYRTGRQTDLEWKGTRVSALMQKLDTEYPNAVSTLLWLQQEPKEAVEALRYYTNEPLGGEAR